MGTNGSDDAVFVPIGYVSDSALADTAIFPDASFESLGFTPNTYTYIWGSGDHADPLTIDVVPEPSTWAPLGVGAGLLGLTLRRGVTRA